MTLSKFCLQDQRYMANLCHLMDWMILNIKFNPGSWSSIYNKNSKPVYWPDKVLKDKEANCVDIGIFVYFLCQFYHFECSLVFISITSKEKVIDPRITSMMHVVPIVRLNDGMYYIFDYIGDNMFSKMHGPFDNLENACEKLASYYEIFRLSFPDFSKRLYNIEPYVDLKLIKNKDLEILYKYKNKNISQYELFTHIKGLKEFVDMCFQKHDLSNASSDYVIIVPPSNLTKSIFNTDPVNMTKRMEYAAFCKGKGYLSLFKPKK